MSPVKRTRSARRPQAPGGPFNVIVISFDTLRRDYLGAYGYPKQVSPTLDALAAQGVRFKDAVVNCGWTLPQHMTLLTGLAPIKHGLVYLRLDCHLPARFRPLAEVFRDNGYLTFGLANQNGFGGSWAYGFARGFRSYTDLFPTNNGLELVVEPARQCLRLAGSRPFFMYLHANDTHEPFAANEPWGSKWGSSYQNRYEGQISYVDHYFGLILEELRRLGQAERTLIVATSDHGTEFQEHGFLEKKLNLYEEIARIPLVMALPGVLPVGKAVPGLCQTQDIAPTILDICALPLPPEMDGRSLLPRIRGKKDPAPEVVFAHTLHEKLYKYEHFSARSARYKLIRTVPLAAKFDKLLGDAGERFARLGEVAQFKRGGWRELYDLQRDPGEQRNIIAEEPQLARDLERKLDAWIRRHGYRPRKSRLM
ncbi:MAG TPA: sulfatase [Armatimonadota bacterium]|nr:sulfatase [Armatimonadota bacterium]